MTERVHDTLDRAHEALARYRATSLDTLLGDFEPDDITAMREACEVGVDSLNAADLHALAGMCIEEGISQHSADMVIENGGAYLQRVQEAPGVSEARRLRAMFEESNLHIIAGLLDKRFRNDSTIHLVRVMVAGAIRELKLSNPEETAEVADILNLYAIILDCGSRAEFPLLATARVADHPDGWHVILHNTDSKENTKIRIADMGPSPFNIVPASVFNGGIQSGPTTTLDSFMVLVNQPVRGVGFTSKPRESGAPKAARYIAIGYLSQQMNNVRQALRQQSRYQRVVTVEEPEVEVQPISYGEHVEWYLTHPDESLPTDGSVEERLIELGQQYEAGELSPHDTYMYGWMQLELARASGLPADFEQAQIIFDAAAEQYREAGETSYAFEARMASLAVPLYHALHTGADMPTINMAIEAYGMGMAGLARELLDNRKRLIANHPEQEPHIAMLLQQMTAHMLMADDTDHYYLMIPSPPRMTDRHALAYYWDGVEFTPTSNVPVYIDVSNSPQRTEAGKIVITPATLDQADKGGQFATLKALLVKSKQRLAGRESRRSPKDKLPDLWLRVEAEIRRAAEL